MNRKTKLIFLFFFFFLLFSLSEFGFAQTETSEVENISDSPWELSDESLREQGWEFQEGELRPGSASAGVLAFSIGSLLHGIGHLYVGDFDSAYRLVVVEAVAVVTWIVGQSIKKTNSGIITSDILLVTSAGLFFTSWIGDIIGSLKGRSIQLPRNQAEPNGLWFEFLYTGLSQSTLGYSGNIQARFPIRSQYISILPELSIQPNLDYRRGNLDIAYRKPLIRRSMFWFGATGLIEQTVIEEIELEPVIATRDAAGIYTRLDFDSGVLLDHLSNMIWTVRIDVMATRFDFNSTREPLRLNELHWTIPVMTQVSFNVSSMLSVTWGFALRNDTSVGAGISNGFMYEIFRFVPRSRFGIEMGAEHGRFLRLWVGLRWQIAGEDTAETLVRGNL